MKSVIEQAALGRTCAALLVALAAGGCSSNSGNHDIPPPPEFINGQFVFGDAGEEAPASKTKESSEKFDWTAAIEFDAPNKSRTNPFVAGVDQDAGSDADVDDDDQDPDGIRIKGFAKVDRMRVFLRVGDDFRPLGVGESLNNVTVIKIQPPHVMLKRDGETVTRSLLEEPIDSTNETRDMDALDDLPEDLSDDLDGIEPPPGFTG